MSNELLWFLFLILDLSMVILMYRFFSKEGLYAVIVMSSIICNIQVVKLVDLFGFTATLGNIVYASNFFATDLLSEFHGKEAARKGVWLGFSSLVIATVWMQIALLFKPSPSDFSQEHLRAIFSLLPRIAFASLTAYLVSQMHDVWAYHFWMERTRGKHLWLRNNASTMISQAMDTLIFTTIAFVGILPPSEFWQVVLTTYVLKWLVAVFDTVFIYIAKFAFEKS